MDIRKDFRLKNIFNKFMSPTITKLGIAFLHFEEDGSVFI